MKKWIRRNRILCIALVVCLIAGGVLLLSIFAAGRARLNQVETLSRDDGALLLTLDATPEPAQQERENQDDQTFNVEDFLATKEFERERIRSHVVPGRNSWREERAEWVKRSDALAEDAKRACNRFAEIVLGIFGETIDPAKCVAAYYVDETGYRPAVWRVESEGETYVGALDGEYKLLSVDGIVEPSSAVHESILGADGVSGVAVPTPPPTAVPGDAQAEWSPNISALDVSSAVSRVLAVLGVGEAQEIRWQGSSSHRFFIDGRAVQSEIAVSLPGGEWVYIILYGDEKLTIETVSVHPDEACMSEGVFWQADLENDEDTVALVAPKNFVKGEPGGGDTTAEEAIAFYNTMVRAANGDVLDADGPEPNLTFYVDKSGARDNYWHVEGELVTFDLSSKKHYLIYTVANNHHHGLGYGMGLHEIPYEEMGDERYLSATRAFFEALYGVGSVVETKLNAVADGHYCTIVTIMQDGTTYETMYQDGMLIEIWYYYTNVNGWGAAFGWEADNFYVNLETGETFYKSDW